MTTFELVEAALHEEAQRNRAPLAEIEQVSTSGPLPQYAIMARTLPPNPITFVTVGFQPDGPAWVRVRKFDRLSGEHRQLTLNGVAFPGDTPYDIRLL